MAHGIQDVLAWSRRHAWGIAVVAAGLSLVALVRPIVQNGDAARYNEQVEAGRFAARAFHIGYMAIGYVFCGLLPGDTDWLMNLLTVLLGTGGALGVYALARTFECSPPASFVAAVSVFAAPLYLLGSVASEVDVPMAALAVIALALWVRGRDGLAAAVFALAMLVTPLSSVALPAFLVPASHLRQSTTWRTHARRVAVFAAVSLLFYAPVVWWHRHGYFYSRRGVLSHGHIELGPQLQRTLAYFRDQRALVACVIAGAIAAAARGRGGSVAGYVLVVAAVTVFGARFPDVPVHLLSTALGAPFIGVAIDWAWKELRPTPRFGTVASGAALAAIVLTVAGTAVGSLAETRRFLDEAMRERALYREMQAAFIDPLLMVSPNHFAQQGRFARALPRLRRQERTLRRATFDENCAEFAKGPPYTFLLNRPPFRAPCPALERRYLLVTRKFRRKSYHFLVAKAERGG